MTTRDKLYTWWKKQPKTVRKSFVFALGMILILSSPIIGTIPGPGGIAVFLAGIAVLASEFGWAESLKVFFLKTVPKQVKNRWQPTAKWELVFDGSALCLLIAAMVFAYSHVWTPVASLGIAGTCLFLFNKDRLQRLKRKLRK